MDAGQTPQRMSLEQLFLDNLENIEKIAISICRRQGCQPADSEDFLSEVKLKLIANDYEALAKFQGRSKLSSYLYVLIQRCFLDFRNQRWGKWRPSAIAQSLGEVAVHLERLLERDGHGLEEARHLLAERHQVQLSAEEFDKLVAGLPRRPRRRFEGEAQLERLPASERADARATAAERRTEATRLEGALGQAIASLPQEERLLLRLHYEEGLRVASIARCESLCPGRSQRKLYSLLQKSQQQVRRVLEEQGFDRQRVIDLLEWEGPAGSGGTE